MALLRTVALIILLNTSLALAAKLNVTIVGLFNHTVVLEVNNEQRLLKVGQTSPEGIKLISADSRSAVLEIEGERATYSLSTHVGGVFTPPPELPIVNLWPTNGMYLTTGLVNGYTVDFVIDTGASAIALNAKTAQRLGLDYLAGNQLAVRTASGVEVAYEVNLALVQLGEIKLHNVRAVVIDGPEPGRALLGMTFLGHLDLERQGERLILKQKY